MNNELQIMKHYNKLAQKNYPLDIQLFQLNNILTYDKDLFAEVNSIEMI